MRFLKEQPRSLRLLLFLWPVSLFFAFKLLQFQYNGQDIIPEYEETIQKERLQRIEDVCRYLPKNGSLLERQKRVMPHLMVDYKHSLTYCWNHKAASTSWSEYFSRLTNNIFFLKSKEFYRLNAYMAPKTDLELKKSLSKTIKFMVIRHPLSRIVSAYRDRIKNNPNSFQAQKFIPLIRKLNPRVRKENSIPSFKEFIEFIVRTERNPFDSHWTPYFLQCDPCSIKYDAIIKTETMKKDFGYLQHKSNLSKKISLEDKYRMNQSAEEEYKITKQYLRQLKRDLFYKLLLLYERDFVLFGYDPIHFSQ